MKVLYGFLYHKKLSRLYTAVIKCQVFSLPPGFSITTKNEMDTQPTTGPHMTISVGSIMNFWIFYMHRQNETHLNRC